jgi:DNA/RNA-binding domain of Phe-tRNA-synthetase-like protein
MKQLNRVFACSNFQRMPHDIRKLRSAVERLERRIAKKRPLR